MACLYDRSEIQDVASTIIQAKGFEIEYFSNLQLYLATNGIWSFRADSITALLGLITVQEAHLNTNSDEHLNFLDFSDIADIVQKEPQPYMPIYKKA